ncbi:energy-coupling factor transporter ATPase [Limosilactobacillus oris]|uniref:energy-coupling factor transporter ATPase n=1 Tax=Limosilactobacillus oris TaxID=1632 RepID=UPI0018834C6E|nr:energy-coupling factor transporter ATPase [Limosilactobacillus oris]MBF0600589.1 energy-coupling factor transporter ATPase [Limosilactobacillus oris]
MDGIKLENITYTYPGASQPVLKKLNLQLPGGQWTTLIGKNGSGKSTIARLIDGLLVADEGQVVVNGLTVTEDHLTTLHRQVGIVFQNPDNQFVGATVADDIAFGLENQQLPRDEMTRRIDKALARVGMSQLADTEPSLLSGGQKQRVAIAGILALEPQVIILDEATSMLDPAGRQTVLNLLTQLRQEESLTIITITHDPVEMTMADKIVVVDQQGIADEGPAGKILCQADLLHRLGVGIPVAQDLSERLAALGVAVPAGYLTTNEMVEWLCRKLS